MTSSISSPALFNADYKALVIGASGAIGANEVLKSEADGSTLWLTSVGAAAINPALFPKLSYNMQKDFAPVSLAANNVEVFVVNTNNPAKDAVELMAAAKAKKELATLGYDKAMGARPLNRVISDKIKNVLTDEILFGKLKKGGFVKIDFEKEFIFTFTSL